MKYLLGLLALILPFVNFAAEEGLDQKIDNFFRPVADFIGGIVFYSISISGHQATRKFDVRFDR